MRDLFPGTTEGSRIAFTSFRNGSFDVYVMNDDGSGQRNLDAQPSGRKQVCLVAWAEARTLK